MTEIYPSFDAILPLENEERVEIATAAGLSILLSLYGPGVFGDEEQLDVAMYPEQAEELVRQLLLAIAVAKDG